MKPTMRPALKKALGMARMPVPRLPFSRWIRVSTFLPEKRDYPIVSLPLQTLILS
jgi:hypothetical protein